MQIWVGSKLTSKLESDGENQLGFLEFALQRLFQAPLIFISCESDHTLSEITIILISVQWLIVFSIIMVLDNFTVLLGTESTWLWIWMSTRLMDDSDFASKRFRMDGASHSSLFQIHLNADLSPGTLRHVPVSVHSLEGEGRPIEERRYAACVSII